MARNLNTIYLRGKGHQDEGTADGTIAPGMCITMAADGKYDPCTGTQAENLKGGHKVAIEDGYQGKTVDDAYSANDIVFFVMPLPGDLVNLLVKSGQNIAVGDKLVPEAGGSGLWVAAAGTEAKYLYEALESTGGALGANALVKCRCLRS